MKRSHRTSSVEYTSTRSPNKILCRGCLGRRLGISCTCGEAKSSTLPHQSPSCCHQDHLCLRKICNNPLSLKTSASISKQAYSNEEAAYWKAGIQPHICSCGGIKSSRCSQNICLRRSQHKSYNSIAYKISTWTQFLFSPFLLLRQPMNNGCRAAPEPSWLPIPKWKLSTNRWK